MNLQKILIGVDFSQPSTAGAKWVSEFLAPNAPFPCEESPYGYQWFGISRLDPKSYYTVGQDVNLVLIPENTLVMPKG